jgi:hypothetical protein
MLFVPVIAIAFALNKCDRPEGYAALHYHKCCGDGRHLDRPEICQKAQPSSHPDERTPAWPKVDSAVSSRCRACARLVDNLAMGLLPALDKRHAELARSHSRSAYARSAALGEVEAVAEAEVDRICNWPRTFHDVAMRRACSQLVEDHADDLARLIELGARAL